MTFVAFSSSVEKVARFVDDYSDPPSSLHLERMIIECLVTESTNTTSQLMGTDHVQPVATISYRIPRDLVRAHPDPASW
ncbi:hypothetical protein RRG08_042702 [Elysia crispata]|uniref:Uncharacterized protein n=1 Tax=Elysia crispata TaxID=231223 RepID=A0AAE0XQ73_9GAST|nr:hypothetical protein RRG08_042702 [Elysia crispata]